MGRMAHETRQINSVTYHISREFDLAGRVESLYYPSDSLRIDYRYHAMGHLRTVEQVAAGATPTTLATYSDYTALGQMQNATYGNGVVTDYIYNRDHHRLENLHTQAEKEGRYQMVQDLTYDFDPVGNVASINDQANGVWSYFDYDELHRLLTARASCPSDPARAYNQVYTYDLAGNMTAKTGRGAFTITAWEDDQLHIRPAAVTYDQAATGVGARQVQYDQDNKPSVITYNGDTSRLYYDGTGSRIRKENNGQSDIYVGGIFEIRDGQIQLNIFANGARLATVRSGQAYYNHGDHLGSTSLVTNASGQVVEEIGYLPFGATLFRNTYDGGVWSSSYRFTGQEYDAEYELYNYSARLYDPTLGRFITADTIVPDWTDPQSLNRYGYCRNNPLIYVDPSGHFAWGAFFIGLAKAIGYGAAIGAAVGGFMAAANGGNIWLGMRDGANSGAISGAMFYCAGEFIGANSSSFATMSEASANVAKAAVHTVAGAASGAVNASITGGDVGQAALIGGLSAGAAKYMGGGPGARILTGAAAGGVSSVMAGGDFAQGAIQGAMTSMIAIMAAGIISETQNQQEPWNRVENNTGGCYECLRLTESELMPGNHSYLWNDVISKGDGMTGSSGSGVHLDELGPNRDACFFIEGSRGIEGQIMQHMRLIRDSGIWAPYLNDCHIKVDLVIDHFGLTNSNAPGRLDSLPTPGRYTR
jgi:RHS repeat-associated protein